MILGERVGAIVAAGGSGQRAGLAKQWLELGGESVLRRSARLLADCAVRRRAGAGGPGRRGAAARPRRWPGLGKPGRVVAGGPARADSVRHGLAALSGCGVVLVHDAARPFATPALVALVAEAAARDGAALAALPVTDTVKRAGAGRAAARGRHPRPPRALAGPDAAGLPPRPAAARLPGGRRRGLRGHRRVRAGGAAGRAGDAGAGRAGQLQDHLAGGRGAGAGPHRGAGGQRRGLRLPPLRAGAEADPGRRRVRGGRPAGPLRRRRLRPRHRRRHPRRRRAGRPGAPLPRHRPALEGGLVAPAAARDRRHGGRRPAGGSATPTSRWRPGGPGSRRAPPRCGPGWRRRSGVSPSQVNVKATTGEGMGFVGRGEGIAAHAVALLVRSGR